MLCFCTLMSTYLRVRLPLQPYGPLRALASTLRTNVFKKTHSRALCTTLKQQDIAFSWFACSSLFRAHAVPPGRRSCRPSTASVILCTYVRIRRLVCFAVDNDRLWNLMHRKAMVRMTVNAQRQFRNV